MKKIVGAGVPANNASKKNPPVSVGVAVATAAAIPTPAPIAIPKSIPRPIAILMEDQKYKQALDEIDDALELNPNKADLHLARGLCHRALKKHVDAASDFDAYARKKPDDIPVRMLLARTYLNVSMYQEAATELTSLLEKKPPPEALWLLGEAKKGLGKPKEATEHYAAACKAGFAPACSAK
jgi:tetratricopeptide (TPR) repeat protein